MTVTQRPQSPPAPLRIGDLIDSKQLEIMRIVGKGAFGAVYAAKDVDSGAFYAVKCLYSNRKTRKGIPLDVQQLFDHEVLLHTAVTSHPNVLTLHRHFTECGMHFIVFDLCAGSDLLTNITNRPLFWRRDDRVRAAFLQIIDAVAHCHAQGIAHRDLKPENVLLMDSAAAEPRYVIADFGLASSRNSTSSHGVGSKYYKSPGTSPLIHPPVASYSTARRVHSP
jgi:serine/threonine protein kinase